MLASGRPKLHSTVSLRAMRMEQPRVRVGFSPGQNVRIITGPFEDFVGTDPRSGNSTPLVAARRLAVYRQLLLDAGVPIN